jgi:hypothetical protein
MKTRVVPIRPVGDLNWSKDVRSDVVSLTAGHLNMVIYDIFYLFGVNWLVELVKQLNLVLPD